MNLFKPPLARTIGVLDKALFSKTISIAAARVRDNKDISLFRQRLEKSKDLLRVERIPSVRSAPETSPASKGAKCLLLQPNVKPGGKN